MSNSNQLHAAAQAAALAVEAWRGVRVESQLVRALVALSRQQWLTEQTSAARESAEEALVLSQRACGDSLTRPWRRSISGGLLVLVDREEEGLPKLSDALDLAERSNAADVAALCRNYRGSAHLQLGRIDGEEELRTSIAAARKLNNHEYVMRGYYNLVEGLWRLGRYDEASDYMDLARDYSQNRDFPVHSYMLDARRFRLMAMHGRWPEAVAGLRSLLDGQDDPGMIGRETLPILARLLVRQGHPDASRILAAAVEHAERADVLDWLVPTGLAWIERAWLTGRPEQANRFQDLLLDRTDRPGMSVQRGELLRYLSRIGYLSRPFPGCPPAYAAGLRGDWQTAAACLGTRRQPVRTGVGTRRFRRTKCPLSKRCSCFSIWVRSRPLPSCAGGCGRLASPGFHAGGRSVREPNPAGLTNRQIEILRMLSTGISNAEIAQRLVVSPRTVDHHVSAILQKLGVRSRREAANRLATLDAADEGRSRCEPSLVDVLAQVMNIRGPAVVLLACTPLSFSDPSPGWPLDCPTGPTRSDHDAIREVVRAAYQQYEPVTGSELFSRYIADLLDFERHSRHGQADRRRTRRQCPRIRSLLSGRLGAGCRLAPRLGRRSRPRGTSGGPWARCGAGSAGCGGMPRPAPWRTGVRAAHRELHDDGGGTLRPVGLPQSTRIRS